MKKLLIGILSFSFVNFLFIAPAFASRGILVIAHGVSAHHAGHHAPAEGPWEKTVREVVAQVQNKVSYPVELAFGMWNHTNFQKGVESLAQKNVTDLRVIPLFISSHSDVIRGQQYQFGLTPTTPFPLEKVVIPTSIKKVTMSNALDDSDLLSDILSDRAKELAQNPEQEELILVAHGPVSDADDELWVRDLNRHAQRVQSEYVRRHTFTLRDDAEPPVRDQITNSLRKLIQDIEGRGHTPVVLPVLMASGGIEKGLIKRLEGLEYRYNGKMIAPDPRLADWIAEQALFY